MFTKLDSELESKFYDVVIVTITSGDRLFHSDKTITAFRPQYNDGTPMVGQEQKAVDLFYAYLWDSQNRDINGQVFQLAMTAVSLLHPKTKFVFLPAFNEWKKLTIGNYVYTYPKLLEFSYLDIKSQRMEEAGLTTNRLNHLTEKQNTDLADQIVAVINQYDFNSVTTCRLNLNKL
jgi:hypothetical protein